MDLKTLSFVFFWHQESDIFFYITYILQNYSNKDYILVYQKSFFRLLN